MRVSTGVNRVNRRTAQRGAMLPMNLAGVLGGGQAAQVVYNTSGQYWDATSQSWVTPAYAGQSWAYNVPPATSSAPAPSSSSGLTPQTFTTTVQQQSGLMVTPGGVVDTGDAWTMSAPKSTFDPNGTASVQITPPPAQSSAPSPWVWAALAVLGASFLLKRKRGS